MTVGGWFISGIIIEPIEKRSFATVIKSGMGGNTAEQALYACSAVSFSYEG